MIGGWFRRRLVVGGGAAAQQWPCGCLGRSAGGQMFKFWDVGEGVRCGSEVILGIPSPVLVESLRVLLGLVGSDARVFRCIN